LVTDDYVLIYLHGGSNRRNVPPFPWLKRWERQTINLKEILANCLFSFSCYQLLDRRLRKSLKHMYLVHPTFWIKSLVWMARPFVRWAYSLNFNIKSILIPYFFHWQHKILAQTHLC